MQMNFLLTHLPNVFRGNAKRSSGYNYMNLSIFLGEAGGSFFIEPSVFL